MKQGCLKACPPGLRRHVIGVEEVGTKGWDRSRLGVGSSLYPLDVFNTSLSVPAATSDPGNRYVFRLCSFDLAWGEWAELLQFRQLATIGAVQSGESGRFLEREIESPLWSFDDGNISWHLGYVPGNVKTLKPGERTGTVPPIFASTSRDLYGKGPALLYTGTSDGQLANPYAAPALPAYSSVGDLHHFYDMRAPWLRPSTEEILAFLVGPGTFFMWCTVKQTSGTTPAPTDTPGLRVEDQFRVGVPHAIYTRVAGAMIFRKGVFEGSLFDVIEGGKS